MKTNKIDQKDKHIFLSVSVDDDQKLPDCSVVLSEKIIDVIKQARGISVTVMDGEKPLFHCISDTAFNSMIEMLDESEMSDVSSGDCKLISLSAF